MSALPKPNPRNLQLTLVPVKAFDPTAPRFVWPPVEGDTEHCDACGRSLDNHDVLTRGAMRAHLRNQEKAGFKAGNQIVHYSPAQRAERNAAVYGTPIPANTLETPLAAPRDASRDARWRKLEAAYVVKWPQTVWLFTLAIAHFAEGNTEAGLENLACFRAKVAEERERRRAAADAAAWEDYRDSVEAQRMAGMV